MIVIKIDKSITNQSYILKNLMDWWIHFKNYYQRFLFMEKCSNVLSKFNRWVWMWSHGIVWMYHLREREENQIEMLKNIDLGYFFTKFCPRNRFVCWKCSLLEMPWLQIVCINLDSSFLSVYVYIHGKFNGWISAIQIKPYSSYFVQLSFKIHHKNVTQTSK